MNVSLVTYTPEPEKVIAMAARTCYGSSDSSRVDVGSLVTKIINLGHESVLEHVSFTFEISGISRACSHQLVRHRIASYSQRSQRYVAERDMETVTPDSVRNLGQDIYTQVIYSISMGYDLLLGRGVPREDARYILPNSCCTDLIMTMNARELRHFLKLRLGASAQWEIKSLAREIHTIVSGVSPLLFGGDVLW